MHEIAMEFKWNSIVFPHFIQFLVKSCSFGMRFGQHLSSVDSRFKYDAIFALGMRRAGRGIAKSMPGTIILA